MSCSAVSLCRWAVLCRDLVAPFRSATATLRGSVGGATSEVRTYQGARHGAGGVHPSTQRRLGRGLEQALCGCQHGGGATKWCASGPTAGSRGYRVNGAGRGGGVRYVSGKAGDARNTRHKSTTTAEPRWPGTQQLLDVLARGKGPRIHPTEPHTQKHAEAMRCKNKELT